MEIIPEFFMETTRFSFIFTIIFNDNKTYYY